MNAMSEDLSFLLDEMGKRDKAFGALYHEVAHSFGLSESAMWTLYFLSSTTEHLTQQDLVERMALPKQTLNSAVSKLTREGLVELRHVQGRGNRKEIVLTKRGKALAESTTVRLRKAELCAASAMGREKVELYIQLHDDFLHEIRRSLVEDGVIDGK